MTNANDRKARQQQLAKAIAVVNGMQRGPGDPPLLIEAECEVCQEAFAMLPQDAARAEANGLATVCRFCVARHRAQNRRARRAAMTTPTTRGHRR